LSEVSYEVKSEVIRRDSRVASEVLSEIIHTLNPKPYALNP